MQRCRDMNTTVIAQFHLQVHLSCSVLSTVSAKARTQPGPELVDKLLGRPPRHIPKCRSPNAIVNAFNQVPTICILSSALSTNRSSYLLLGLILAEMHEHGSIICDRRERLDGLSQDAYIPDRLELKYSRRPQALSFAISLILVDCRPKPK